jgi:hypothetical protein
VAQVVEQSQDPEFIPQYHQKKKKSVNFSCNLDSFASVILFYFSTQPKATLNSSCFCVPFDFQHFHLDF